MATDNVDIAIRLRGARQFAQDARMDATALSSVGTAAQGVTAKASVMGGMVSRALDSIARGAKYASFGVVGLGLAGAKMGLSFNAQLESSRLRFGLFTNDVDGLTDAVSKIDINSAFGLADLSDAAALFGNSGIQNIPDVLQAAANAAAASGKGVQSLNSIATALSQIQSKGRLSQEEINQLNEAGAPGAQRIIAQHFGLTAKELQNLGGQGLDATEAIQALTREWTSGRMAKAAEDQTKTLGGQWNLLTGNAQKFTGVVTEDLARGLRESVLPAANDTATALTKIFGNDSLTDAEKMQQAFEVIKRQLGPVADQIGVSIEDADIPEKLGKALDKAGPVLLDAGKDAAGFFVEAWLDAPVWAQVLSAAWLGKKLFGGVGASVGKGVGEGIGQGIGRGIGSQLAEGIGGKFAEAFLGRGATPARPLFVLDVASGAGKGWLGDAAKKAATVAGTTATVAQTGGAVAGGTAAAATVVIGGITYLAIKEGHHDYPTRGPRASSPSSSNGSVPPPGFGTGTPGALNVNATFNVDGKTVSRTTATTDRIEANRAAAVSRASR